MSLRTRIAAVAGLAVAIAVVSAAAIVYVGVRSELRDEVERTISERADGLASGGGPGPDGPGGPLLGGRRGADGGPPFDGRREADDGPFDGPPGGDPGGPGDLDDDDDPLRRLEQRTPFGGAAGYAQLVRPTGTVLRPPDAVGRVPVTGRAKEIARAGSGRHLADIDVDGSHLMVITVGAGAAGAVQVARPLNEVDRQLESILVVLALVAVAGVALGAALGALVARAALAPIARFTRQTEALTADPDLSGRIEVTGRDELARMAASFNTTLDALERSVEAQRHLVADAGHELRTPIASLRANIQVLEDAERLPAEELARLRADIVDELDQLTELVADVVELARGSRPQELLDDVRVDHVIASVAERAQRRAGDRVVIETELEPTLVRGDPERIGRAVSNLLDNAVKWSDDGGTVDVELRDGELSVRDHGAGFAEDDLPHVFDRFYRAGSARGMPGSGLGLAIVRQAAEAHGGSVAAANAPDGGAVLRVSFGSYVVPTHA